MFQSLAITALRSERHNSYSPGPTLAFCAIISFGTLGLITFAPAVLIIIALVVATFAGCVLATVGAISWAIITDASRTRSRLARETLERLASVEEGIGRIYSLLVSSVTPASEDDEYDSQVERELGVLFGGADTYEDIVILRDAIPMNPEDYEVTEDTWTSVLPGYRGTWAAAELAEHSVEDRIATYSEGTDDDAPLALSPVIRTALTNHFSEWKNVMSRVKAEMDAIMIERAAALAPAPVVSEPCPLTVLADDGCPHSMSDWAIECAASNARLAVRPPHSKHWGYGESVVANEDMIPERMDYSPDTATRHDRPCLAMAANSPVVGPVEEVVALAPVVIPEGKGWHKESAGVYRNATGWTIVKARGGWTVSTIDGCTYATVPTLAKGKEWVRIATK